MTVSKLYFEPDNSSTRILALLVVTFYLNVRYFLRSLTYKTWRSRASRRCELSNCWENGALEPVRIIKRLKFQI